ncbi:MAG: maltose alpha-D-glucosyltransferase [Pseudomonadota bacterium]
MSLRADPLWYKDAVIYQTHIKAFFDSNNDGVGDFCGLIAKLDYIEYLGATAIWLMPFYPSPMRDDGYDISDYRQINPAFGTMADFRRLVREAHRRGLRIITELVINHTSDQHPWFERARRAKSGSSHRDFYVWSDNDHKYGETRIIFLDTETSNWTWDPVAQAYYWHRFYSHQPDLNFDNPAVRREVMALLRFWLDTGVDGLRLDAIPYLIEREGTNCENLDETHQVLKELRAEMDARYQDRMFLAEANQWPEDTRPYFGDGDECHMGFHFPLMPRMFLAIAQEDRHPITDIIRQTPDIPENCQWAIFLRNHDELTLEMVTEHDREYLWNTYAADSRMRINLGIRRRLAPLMDHDRRKIELMKLLLFSMPGTPIIYYGDELGLGDNVYLGDRDGVRTPMQWSPDRNGGFSRANPQALYLPPVMDPLYGYAAVNVESQQSDPSSLLNWTRRMIAVRRTHPAFGRGSLRFLYPGNRKILAFVREYEDDCLLCVFNLSRSAQSFQLELGEFAGRVPVELLGRTPFMPVGETGYPLTLPGYGFYWFILSDAAAVPTWHEPAPEPLPEFLTIVLRDGWRSVIDGRETLELTRDVLPAFVTPKRWFGAKDAKVRQISFGFSCVLPGPNPGLILAELQVVLAGKAEPQNYVQPFAIAWGDDRLSHGSAILPHALAKVRKGAKVGALYDAAAADDLFLSLIDLIHDQRDVEGRGGRAVAFATSALEGEAPGDRSVRRLGVEQSNTSAIVDGTTVVKLFRRLHPGVHPEVEVSRFLTEVAHFEHAPALIGAVEWHGDGGESTALAVAVKFVSNQGDAWSFTLDYLDRTFEHLRSTPTPEEAEEDATHHADYLAQAHLLGERVAGLHHALATETDDPAFVAEPIEAADLDQWVDGALRQAEAASAEVKRRLPTTTGSVAELGARFLDARETIVAKIEAVRRLPVQAAKTRMHGDLHLGQVLVAQGDFLIIDFEGEPAAPLAERRGKSCPLRDVAGIVRSFDYAAWSSLRRYEASDADAYDALFAPAMAWRDSAIAAFLDGYRTSIAGCASYPAEGQAEAMMNMFVLQKALYEICYEAANRPQWLEIPLRGVDSLIAPARDDG